MEKFVNTFSGGLDRDTAPTKYSNIHYFNLENFRVITDDDSGVSSGSLNNVLGNAIAFTLPNFAFVIGWAVMRNDLILITTCWEADPDRIYKLPISELSSAQDIQLTDTYYFNGTYGIYVVADVNYCDGLIYKGDLNLSIDHPVRDIVTNYENSSIQKIYWADGYNPLYHLNIVHDININPLDTLDVDRLKILPEHTYGTFNLSLATGGILKSGRVQYAYQLYSVNGTETMFSPASCLFNLTAADYPSADTTRFGGSNLEEYTNKAVNIIINLEDDYSDFNRLRLVALDYQAYGNVPTVRIVTEMAIASNTIYITDFGYKIGDMVLEEFQILRNDIIPQTLVNKNNYLLAGNITETWFDVDQLYLDTMGGGDHPFLDTRAYRWRYSTTIASYIDVPDENSDPAAVANGNQFSLDNGSYVLQFAGFWELYIIIDPNTAVTGHCPFNHPLGTFVTVDTTATELLNEDYLEITIGVDTCRVDLGTLLPSTSYLPGGGSGGEDIIYMSGTGMIAGHEPSADYAVDDGDTMDVTGSDGSYNVTDTFYYQYSYTEAPGAGTWQCVVDYDLASERVIDDGTTLDYTNVPEDHDARNFYNNIDNDVDPDGADYQFKYQEGIVGAPAGFADLGGTGPIISYEFAEEAFDMGTEYTEDNFPLWRPDTASEAYDNPEVACLKVSYARDEVYRIGVIFYDLKGRFSYVKWIGDIRMPNWEESNIMDSAGNGNILYIKFTIDWDALPAGFKSEISGIRYVRVQREDFDKTIKGMGAINPTFNHIGNTNNYSPHCLVDVTAYIADDATPTEFGGVPQSDNMNQDLVDFICPEVAFNKEMTMSVSGFLEAIGNLELSATSAGYQNFEDAGADDNWTFLYNDTTIHSLTVADRAGLRRDSDEWLLTTPEQVDPPAYNIDGNSYYNRVTDFLNADEHWGFKGTSMIINLNSAFDTAKLTGGTATYEGLFGVYRIPLGDSLYGGNTYENRSVNQYIPASRFIIKDTSPAEQESSVYGGDTYICMFTHLWAFVDREERTGANHSIQSLLNFPVETGININYRTDLITYFFTHTDGAGGAIPEYYLSEIETIGVSQQPSTYPDDAGNLYRYNNAYSSYDMSHQYLPKPFDFSATTIQDTKVMSSELKVPNEYSDSWLKFLHNNYQILDTQYGAVTRILHKNNRIVCFQPQAIALLSVMERESVQTQNTNTLGVGTGGVLSRYDYASTTSGSSIHKGIIPTDLGLFYVDDYNVSIRRFGEQLEPISETKGLKSFFEGKIISDAITAYDAANREVLFYLTYEEDYYQYQGVYGILYNWYAVDDSRELAASGWHVPTNADFETLGTYIDNNGTYDNNIIGQALKETGDHYWGGTDPGNNTYKFNLRGSGHRSYVDGSFAESMEECHLWHASEYNTPDAYYSYASDDDKIFHTYISSGTYVDKKAGKSVRLIKDATSLSEGEAGTYTGNDGKIYTTICIGTQEWLSENLAETLYRTGEEITEEEDASAWAGLGTASAMCYYDNKVYYGSPVNPYYSVLCFNGFIDAFSGFYTYSPAQWIWFRKTLISCPWGMYFYRHNEGAYGVYYDAFPSSSTITLIINPDTTNVVRFDMIEWLSKIFDVTEIEQLTETFDRMKVLDSYQSTGWIDLDSTTNVTRRLRKWRMNTIRHEDIEGGLFEAADQGRIRDTYISLELEYYNQDDYKFMLDDIITNWFPTKIR